MTFASHTQRLALTLAVAMPLGLGFSLPALSPAQAATSAWAENAGGRMRLVALSPDDNGKIRAGLQIEPNAGWITYWREPGNTGIPPQIVIAPGTGVTLDKISYPIPKHIKSDEIDDVGYDAPVTLPLTLSAKSGVTEIKAQAFIGICKDICVPFQADLTVALPAAGQSQPQEEAILDAAEARLPEASSSEFKVTEHTLSPDRTELKLDITLPDIGDTTPDVIVAGPSGYVFTKQLMSKRDGTALTTTVAIGKLPRNYDISGKSWSALVIDGARAIESPLAFD
ncbi:DsbC/DsbD-like thiol-disulfide interchange protein [Rhizobium metallidurans]|uniref:DsbC/DsbD-like thiol-disulfide interchange protein n=2 Tax=Rhizobium metallidurans TaxID=1265931 RepID=A0A7W6CQP2_9HYPH|nr:DsbC/DsbD-like thiol-disulfide interchange protein [Rhizobium metallidurans]